MAIEPTAEELALLRAASVRVVSLPMRYGDAVNRRQRLYECRKFLEKQNHWLMATIGVVRISINCELNNPSPDSSATMVLSPGIADFNDLIRSSLSKEELEFIELDGTQIQTELAMPPEPYTTTAGNPKAGRTTTIASEEPDDGFDLDKLLGPDPDAEPKPSKKEAKK